jgi:hypothetical protein
MQQISLVVLSWGIVASMQSIATSYPILILFRTLLGIGEAAFSGVPFYLSFFYKKDELAFRTALFIAGKDRPEQSRDSSGMLSTALDWMVLADLHSLSCTAGNDFLIVAGMAHTQGRRTRPDCSMALIILARRLSFGGDRHYCVECHTGPPTDRRLSHG